MAAVLLVAGGGVFLGKPFESSRHKETASDAALGGTVRARLWQDPFTAVVRCQKDKTAEKEDCTPVNPELAPQQEVVIMPVMVYGDSYSESVEKRRRRRYAVLSAMFKQGYRPEDAQTIDYFKKKAPQNSYIVPYEWLRPNTSHYGRRENPKKTDGPPVLLLWLDERRFSKKPLNELREILTQVVGKTAAAGEDVANPAVQVTLIGPAGSTVLRDMVREASHRSLDSGHYFPREWKFTIFSPVATASARLVMHGVESQTVELHGKKTCPDTGECKAEKKTYENKNLRSLSLIEKAFRRIGVEFFRTISSDKALIREMIEKEFRNRGIKDRENSDVIILVSEWDTFYGRSLPEAFIEVLDKDRERKETPEDICPLGVCPLGVCRYVYMRGLDGEIPESKAPENGASDRTATQELERAVGVNRFDYLRRLAQRIKRDFFGRPESVRAVGVLGSDVYDKLVVLQALRPSFPDALFFITDADARYLHPAEFGWTRGLVVLSGYNLTLAKNQMSLPTALNSNGATESNGTRELKLELPPFRDSYQTSVFYTTRLAIAHSLQALETSKREREEGISKDETQWCERCDDLRRDLVTIATPKVFEVGRSMFVPLDGKEQEDLRKQMWSGWANRKFSALLPAAAGFVLLCSFLSVQFNRRFNWRIWFLVPCVIVVPLLLTAAVHFADGFDGEPLPITSGANMLPTLSGLFLALILMSFFFFRSQANLAKHGRRLVKEFELTDDKSWAQYLLPTEYFAGYEVLSLSWLWRWLTTAWRAVRSRYWMYGLTVLHLVFSVALVNAVGDFSPPIRGHYTRFIYHVTVLLMLAGFLALAYLFVDEVRKCRTLARRLISAPAPWGDQTLETFAQQRSIRLYASGSVRDGLARWIGVRLLAEKTLASENVIYYPFVVLLLIIVVHSGLFDNWRFVPSIILVLVTGVLVIAACILFLRFSVKQVRDSALTSMQMALARDLRDGAENEIQSLKLMIEDVRNERRGAFRPVFNDPIFKALLMPLGGYGSLYLIDYLARFTQG